MARNLQREPSSVMKGPIGVCDCQRLLVTENRTGCYGQSPRVEDRRRKQCRQDLQMWEVLWCLSRMCPLCAFSHGAFVGKLHCVCRFAAFCVGREEGLSVADSWLMPLEFWRFSTLTSFARTGKNALILLWSRTFCWPWHLPGLF